MVKFNINARGLWTIKHLTCGAMFQVSGDKIWDGLIAKCPNCEIPVNIVSLKQAIIDLDNCQNNIKRASERNNDPSTMVWQINPPIEIIEEEPKRILLDLT